MASFRLRPQPLRFASLLPPFGHHRVAVAGLLHAFLSSSSGPGPGPVVRSAGVPGFHLPKGRSELRVRPAGQPWKTRKGACERGTGTCEWTPSSHLLVASATVLVAVSVWRRGSVAGAARRSRRLFQFPVQFRRDRAGPEANLSTSALHVLVHDALSCSTNPTLHGFTPCPPRPSACARCRGAHPPPRSAERQGDLD